MSEIKDYREMLIDKYSRDELILEAETVEEYGEYIHMDLMGYTAEELREMAEKAKK